MTLKGQDSLKEQETKINFELQKVSQIPDYMNIIQIFTINTKGL